MLAATASMPMPESGPSLGRKWMKANIIAAAVYAAVGVVTFATDALLGTNPGTFGKGFAAAIALIGAVVSLGAYAMLTGAVLSEKLPAFSRRGWLTLHLVIGTIIGALFALQVFANGAAATQTIPPIDRKTLFGALVVVLIIAPMIGAIMGSLQSIVLGRAARGLGAWIASSALASSILFMALLGVAVLAPQPASGMLSMIIMQGALVAGMTGGALVTLLAVKRLKPRV